MIFFGVYRCSAFSSAFLERSSRWKVHRSSRLYSSQSPARRSPTCATTDDTALTEEDRFMRTKEKALIEQAAMSKAKEIIDRSGSLYDTVKEARWQYKVHRRAKEILEDLGDN